MSDKTSTPFDRQTLDEWMEEERRDIAELNSQLAEGEYISPDKVEVFGAFWRAKHALLPQIYPMNSEGYGDLFWIDMFNEWLETGTVDEQVLIDMACLDYPESDAKTG